MFWQPIRVNGAAAASRAEGSINLVVEPEEVGEAWKRSWSAAMLIIIIIIIIIGGRTKLNLLREASSTKRLISIPNSMRPRRPSCARKSSLFALWLRAVAARRCLKAVSLFIFVSQYHSSYLVESIGRHSRRLWCVSNLGVLLRGRKQTALYLSLSLSLDRTRQIIWAVHLNKYGRQLVGLLTAKQKAKIYNITNNN